MENIVINDKKYSLIKNFRDGYEAGEVQDKLTEYYDDFDYIVGDWAYGKLRLKGFYDSKNSKVKDFNNYEKVESYIKNNCAYGCKYFILQKQ